MSGLRFSAAGTEPFEALGATVEALNRARGPLSRIPVSALVALFEDFGRRLLDDVRARELEGAAFLAAWLKRGNLEKMLALNLGGGSDVLEGFVPRGGDLLGARPRGLVAMWMPANVPTLPVFSFVPALLTKNVCLVKLTGADPEGMDELLRVLASASGEGLAGADVLKGLAIVWFDSGEARLSEEMSLAADAKVVWGRAPAIRAIRALPQADHCVNVEFGPKYSFGVIGRRCLEDPRGLADTVAAFVRDIALFDQRACSSPQTIFCEANAALALADVGALFAAALAKLPPKRGLDAFTASRIAEARAAWALDGERDVLASRDGPNWTVLMDSRVSLKEAVQSRTIHLTQVASWRDVVPLVTPAVQTIGIAFGDRSEALAFAEAASFAGCVRCVRPGLMNVHESPWDGKLLAGELVRWVSVKP